MMQNKLEKNPQKSVQIKNSAGKDQDLFRRTIEIPRIYIHADRSCEQSTDLSQPGWKCRITNHQRSL